MIHQDRLNRSGFQISIGLILGSIILGCGAPECNDPANLGKAPGLAVPPLEWGEIPAGQRSATTLTVRNNSTAAVDLVAVETSCPCLQITSLPARFESGTTRTLVLSFDPTTEPEFRGRLRVDLVGRSSKGSPLFRSHADFSVATRAETPFRPVR